jgi:renalase
VASIAIIGAGSSALAAAHTLQDAGHTVTLFEKSSIVGGRATTRERESFIYDSGAQYIKGGSAVSDALIRERFYVDDLIDISKPVWIFDGEGHISEGDPVQNADPKWNYRSGLIALAERMAEGLDVHLEICIGRVEQSAGRWRLFDETGHNIGNYERLLITIPATEAAMLIEASQIGLVDTDLRYRVGSLLRRARYNPLLSVMLGYRSVPRARPYYALVNTDKAHAISWLAWEHEKSPARVPEHAGLLIAQMAPGYSRESWERPREEIFSDVARQVAALIDEALPEPVFTDIVRWQYALPAERADADELNKLAMPMGLAFCGDAFVGGRVHLTLEHGIEVARGFV